MLLKKTVKQQGVNLSGELRELFGGGFGKLRRKRGIKHAFTPADSPKSNGVAERALALINDIQAPLLYPSTRTLPSLWADAVSWPRHVLNRIATTANSGDRSPYEMWYCLTPPPRGVWPFLKAAICRVKGDNKSQRKEKDCYYVGHSVDHPVTTYE